MVEKIKTVNNPLTIIGIFAALSEVAGTVTIGLIPVDLQRTFLWFLIGFPVLLVSMFFFTLFKKREALYSPGDYENEENFMKNLVKTVNKDNIVRDSKIEIEKIVNSLKEDIKLLNSTKTTKNIAGQPIRIQEDFLSKLDSLSGSVGTVITTISGMSANDNSQSPITNQTRIINYLAENGEKLFMDICNDLSMGKMSASTALQKLEKKGLVIHRGPEDGKRYSINKDV